jgi:UPF0716 protein FxsA
MALLLLILWPLAELFVAIEVAHVIGVLLTVVLLLVGFPVGLWLARAEGRLAWRRLNLAVADGAAPGREVLDGALALIGGLLVMVPGFITDVIGFVLLVAPTRRLTGRAITRNLQSRLVRTAARFSRASRSAYDVDSTATDLGQPHLPR